MELTPDNLAELLRLLNTGELVCPPDGDGQTVEIGLAEWQAILKLLDAAPRSRPC